MVRAISPRLRRLWSADTSRRFPAGTHDRRGPHRDAAKASPGCAAIWARIAQRPIVHPQIVSGFGMRIMGLKMPDSPGQTAATIIPSVGCPMGCNFCTTSAFFGGKGKYLNFYEPAKSFST